MSPDEDEEPEREPPEGPPDGLRPPEEQNMDDLEEFYDEEHPEAGQEAFTDTDEGTSEEPPAEGGWGQPPGGAPTFTHAPDNVPGLRWHGNIAPLIAALAKAQAEFPEIERTEQTKFKVNKDKPNKPTREVNYWYAPLRELVQKLRDPLNEEGLALMQPVSEGKQSRVVRTILAHETGAFVESSIALPEHEDPQEMASLVTYMRRYQLASLLGVSSETDDDGQAASNGTPTRAPAGGDTIRVTGTSPDDPDEVRNALKNMGFGWNGEDAWVLEDVDADEGMVKSVESRLPDRLNVEVA